MEQGEYYAWIRLALTPYIGPETFLKLLSHYQSATAALAAPPNEIRSFVRNQQALASWQGTDDRGQRAAEAALKWVEGEGCRLLLLCENDFPERLGEGLTPPPLLFLRGRAALLQRPSVSIVGSRHASPQAVRIAHDFGRALSEHGVAVVSGMAAGIDTAAHQGALKASGSTIAFWGTGIDRIYPADNRPLAYQIAEQGLIVSEFPLGTRPLAGNFPRRNRLIAALSEATLVVEAALESGSLITARLAGEMGREVLAVPGSIDNPHAKGCHRLIKDGAKLVESLEDVLQECPQLLQKTIMSSVPEHPQTAVVHAAEADTLLSCLSEQPDAAWQAVLGAMGYDPVHPDSLAAHLNLPAAEVYGRLLEMELDGVVAALAGGRYQRVGK